MINIRQILDEESGVRIDYKGKLRPLDRVLYVFKDVYILLRFFRVYENSAYLWGGEKKMNDLFILASMIAYLNENGSVCMDNRGTHGMTFGKLSIYDVPTEDTHIITGENIKSYESETSIR